MKKNEELRKIIKESGVRHWQIADELGISEATFCKKLRYELEPLENEKILQAILKLTL